jgi:hypothetical protein
VTSFVKGPRMRRCSALVSLVAVVGLLSAGCGTGKNRPSRALAAGLLLGLTAVAAGGTVYAARMSDQKEKDLRDDVQSGNLSGRQFAERDEEGEKWNRTARASAFVGVVGVVGLIIVGEMMLADGYEYGPIKPPTSKPIIPGETPDPPPTAKIPGLKAK